MKKVDDNRFHDRIRKKNTIRSSGLRVFGLLLIAWVASACALGEGGFGPSRRPPLLVGVSPTYAPVIFETDGEIVGIEADLARILGRALGREIVFRRHPFPDLLDALLRGEIDVVMSGLSITPERAERVRAAE